MKFKEFLSTTWREIFLFNGITCFEDIWALGDIPNLQSPLVTSYATLRLTHGGSTAISIKKYATPIKNTLPKILPSKNPFAHELKYFWILKQLNIPTIEVIYYHTQKLQHTSCFMLITCPLSHFIPLNILKAQEYYTPWISTATEAWQGKHRVFRTLAEHLRCLHHHNICHNRLYDKNIYVRYHSTGAKNHCEQLKVILAELTHAQRCFFKFTAKFHDLSQILASLNPSSTKDNVRFYQYYYQRSRLNYFDKWWFQRLLKRSRITA